MSLLEQEGAAKMVTLITFCRMPKPEVADFVKAFGQDMLQVAAHELVAGERAGLVATGLSILVAEGDVGVVEGDQAPVGDGDAKGVTGEIVEHRLLALAPGLDVDDPALPPDVIGKFDVGIDRHQGFSEQAGRALGKGGFGEEKGRRCLMPGVAVRGQATSCDQAMDVRMIVEALRPAMENREHAGRAAEPARITAKVDDRLGGRIHQRAIAQALPSADDGVEFLGQGDGDMEIRDRQHLGLTLFQPFPGLITMTGRATAVAARMEDMHLVAAAIALPELPAKRQCRQARMSVMARRCEGGIALTPDPLPWAVR